MNRKVFLDILGALTFLMSVGSSGCQVAKVQTNEVLKKNAGKNIPIVEEVKPSSHDGSIKWLYIEEPLDFGTFYPDIVSDVGSSKVSIFYQNGEFGRMLADLKRTDNNKMELRAAFDEIVQYGKWKVENGQVKLTIQKCRCTHCDEDHGDEDTKGKTSKDPTPLHEIWTIGKDDIGKVNSLLIRSSKKYQFIEENEFIFSNYNEMIAEPLKVKNYNGNRYCISSDLKDF